MAAFGAALTFVLLLGVVHPAFAQESAQESTQGSPQESPSTAGVFGVSDVRSIDGDSPKSRLHLRPDVQLIEILAPAERAAARASVRGVSPVMLGPFGRAYPFARVRVYLGHQAPPEEERGSVDEAAPRLVVSADDRRGRTRWWRLAAKENEDSRDLFRISNEPDATERIAPAANPAIPFVLVRYGFDSPYTTTTIQLLLDFRAAQPNVFAAYEAWSRDGGGCATLGVKTGTSCAWNAQRGDFLCTERSVRSDTMWTSRRSMTRQFWLASAATAAAAAVDADSTATAYPPPAAALDEPASAGAIVQRLTDAADGAVTAAVPRLGATHHLANGVLADGVRYRLFAAPGIGSQLDARIVAVITRPGEAPRLVMVRQTTRLASNGSSVSTVDDGLPADAVAEHDATFTAIRVAGGDAGRDVGADASGNAGANSGAKAGAKASAEAIYKIIVSEEAGDSMYIVAISAGQPTPQNMPQDSPRLDALLLATDAQSADNCSFSAVPETAVRADIVDTASFTMDIEVEPRRLENDADVDPLDEEIMLTFLHEQESSCAWRGTVRWSLDSGFEVKKATDICDAQARIAVIGDDGSLTASPVLQRVDTSDLAVRYLMVGRGAPTLLLLSDPDFSERLWAPLMEQLARTHPAVVFTPRRWRPDRDVLKPLVSQVQAVVEAVQAKRVFVVAHGLATGYAAEWAAAHRELVAGFLFLHPVESTSGQGPRLHAITGSKEDRQAYVRSISPESAPADVEKIAATMNDRSSRVDLDWLRTTATLLGYSMHDGAERLKGIPISTTPVQSPGPFAMFEKPAEFSAFLEAVIRACCQEAKKP
jgi:pimeloyl-ACP methyl ester carboxylesterase